MDVRLISATNKDLRQAIAAGSFREDLFYRLNVLPLSLPPLRQRREDIPLLMHYFLRRDGERLGVAPKKITPTAMRRLVAHPWKGNIREMENLVRYLLTTLDGETIDESDLPPAILDIAQEGPASPKAVIHLEPRGRPGPSPTLYDQTWEELERSYVLALLERCKWNITQAAARAGVNRSTFDSRMKKLGIRKKETHRNNPAELDTCIHAGIAPGREMPGKRDQLPEKSRARTRSPVAIVTNRRFTRANAARLSMRKSTMPWRSSGRSLMCGRLER